MYLIENIPPEAENPKTQKDWDELSPYTQLFLLGHYAGRQAERQRWLDATKKVDLDQLYVEYQAYKSKCHIEDIMPKKFSDYVKEQLESLPSKKL